MIWLKDGQKIVGYVPYIEKRYTREELFELNAHCPYQGWSNLAQLVMITQGISYESDSPSIAHTHEDAVPLADVKFDFSFECFDKDDFESELYVKDIHTVFEGLKLYKVTSKDIVVLNCAMSQVPKYWKHIITDETLDNMLDDLNWTIQTAERVANNIKTLFKKFEDLGLSAPDIFYDKTPEDILSTMYDKRVCEKRINYYK